MKFKSLTKLAMSGVALAAVATTLGASTYAWYVTNSTATATNIEAKTISSDGSNLLVSKNGANYSSKVVFDTVTDPEGYDNMGVAIVDGNKTGVLDPVTVDGTAFTGDFITYDTESDESSASSAYLHFHLWIKSSKATNVNPVLTVVNESASDLPAQRAYYSVGSTQITAGQTFTVDGVRALRTSITQTVESGTEVTATADVEYTSTNTTVYKTATIGKQADGSNPYSPAGTVTTVKADEVNYVTDAGAAEQTTATGAHAYYTAVMAKQPQKFEDSVTVSTSASISQISLTAETAVRLDFFVWLEGSDTFCFDACGGQTFKFGLIFNKA